MSDIELTDLVDPPEGDGRDTNGLKPAPIAIDEVDTLWSLDDWLFSFEIVLLHKDGDRDPAGGSAEYSSNVVNTCLK